MLFRYINIYRYRIFLLDWALYHYVMPFFVSYYSLLLKSILCDVTIQAFFG